MAIFIAGVGMEMVEIGASKPLARFDNPPKNPLRPMCAFRSL